MRLPDLNITDHQREKNILDNIRVDHQDLTQLKWQDWVKLILPKVSSFLNLTTCIQHQTATVYNTFITRRKFTTCHKNDVKVWAVSKLYFESLTSDCIVTIIRIRILYYSTGEIVCILDAPCKVEIEI